MFFALESYKSTKNWQNHELLKIKFLWELKQGALKRLDMQNASKYRKKRVFQCHTIPLFGVQAKHFYWGMAWPDRFSVTFDLSSWQFWCLHLSIVFEPDRILKANLFPQLFAKNAENVGIQNALNENLTNDWVIFELCLTVFLTHPYPCNKF